MIRAVKTSQYVLLSVNIPKLLTFAGVKLLAPAFKIDKRLIEIRCCSFAWATNSKIMHYEGGVKCWRRRVTKSVMNAQDCCFSHKISEGVIHLGQHPPRSS